MAQEEERPYDQYLGVMYQEALKDVTCYNCGQKGHY